MGDKRKERQSSGETIALLPADKKKKKNSNDSEEADEVFETSNMADREASKFENILSRLDKIEVMLTRLDKLDNMKQFLNKTLPKLNAIETRVNHLDIRVESLDSKSRVSDKEIGDLKASVDFVPSTYEANMANLAEALKTIKTQETEMGRLRQEILYSEAYSRRENLIISGIPEVNNSGKEDTLEVL